MTSISKPTARKLTIRAAVRVPDRSTIKSLWIRAPVSHAVRLLRRAAAIIKPRDNNVPTMAMAD